MIEIKNISKTYKTKKGLEVAALKNISLNFPDKGMVFVLGKSGSGKSTLLNVLGGLDNYDSGEFLIKGKSSKDFTQADFDSYRNTLIGFIFQDYNILEEFNIGANIALALQLQGKKADSAAVNGILDEVDLTGYGNRKPNELSGGQKQRVAIARALIKSPDIIMADEPTGALDSNTGRQVFDTLKKLSKDKLVIIVSHDREFAEYYGDRVIELKDGEVISDISKYEAPAEVKSEGLKIIDNKVMQLKKGYELTDKDLQLIKNFIKNSETDSFLSLDGRTNENFKQIAMISDDGSKQSFKDTDNEIVLRNSIHDEYKIIHSRLPLKHSLRIALSSLKAKPVKLIITILLSMVAFGLFGFADTFAAFDTNKALVNSMMANEKDNLSISKSNMEDNLFDNDLIDFINKNVDIKAKGVYQGGDLFNAENFADEDIAGYPYYAKTINGYIEMSKDEFAERNLKLTGKAAENASEIVITNYSFESFKKYGFKGVNIKGEAITINAADIGDEISFISKDLLLNLNGNAFKIVGIVDTNLNFENQNIVKAMIKEPNFQSEPDEYKIYADFNDELSYSYHNLAYVSLGTINSLINKDLGTEIDDRKGSFSLTNVLAGKVATFEKLKSFGLDYKLRTENSNINNNSVLLSSSDFIKHLSYQHIYVESYEELSANFAAGMYDEYLEIEYNATYYSNYEYESGVKTIAGFYQDDEGIHKTFIVGNGLYESLTKKGTYYYAIGNMPKNRDDIELLFKLQNSDNPNQYFQIEEAFISYITETGEFFKKNVNIFIYAGIGVALFSALMLMNYISSSISYKKREIGILRAVGAKGSDVFGIFCCESMFIAVVNAILALLVSVGICIGVNIMISNDIGVTVKLLTIGIRQISLVVALSIGSAFLSSLIPVLKISRKRPIDAIRNR